MEPNQFVVEHLGSLPAGQMVDLAGGEGRNALWFASHGWQVENVEISQVALEKFLIRAKQDHLESNCTATHANALEARFKMMADLLVVAYLQIPFQDLAKALTNAVSQLSPTAEVFGVWHARRNLTEGFGGPPVAEVLPTVSELEAWATSHLRSHEVFEKERIVEKDGVKHVAIDVILKGRLGKNQ